MTREEIIFIVTSYIEQHISGLEVENSKVDFKSRWYVLTDEKGINEFLKDTTAIVNTFGPDGFIVIGYDESDKKLFDSSFSDSGLSDTSKLIDLINKKVDRLFNVDILEQEILGNKISIIHLPPSFDKPHVIRNYRYTDKNGNSKEEPNKVFVRKGSTTRVAGKTDFELMYWDRKNITPEYQLHSAISDLRINAKPMHSGSDRLIDGFRVNFYLTIENYGSRPTGLKTAELNLTYFENPAPHEILVCRDYLPSTIIIKPGEVIRIAVQLSSSSYSGMSYNEGIKKMQEFQQSNKYFTNKITYTTVFGNKIVSDLIFT